MTVGTIASTKTRAGPARARHTRGAKREVAGGGNTRAKEGKENVDETEEWGVDEGICSGRHKKGHSQHQWHAPPPRRHMSESAPPHRQCQAAAHKDGQGS